MCWILDSCTDSLKLCKKSKGDAVCQCIDALCCVGRLGIEVASVKFSVTWNQTNSLNWKPKGDTLMVGKGSFKVTRAYNSPNQSL